MASDPTVSRTIAALAKDAPAALAAIDTARAAARARAWQLAGTNSRKIRVSGPVHRFVGAIWLRKSDGSFEKSGTPAQRDRVYM